MPRSKAQSERNKKLYEEYTTETQLRALLQHEIFTKLAKKYGISPIQAYRVIRMMREQEGLLSGGMIVALEMMTSLPSRRSLRWGASRFVQSYCSISDERSLTIRA